MTEDIWVSAPPQSHSGTLTYMASWQHGSGAKALRLCGIPTPLHIFISVVFWLLSFFFPASHAPIVKLQLRKVSHWDPAATPFSLNRLRQAALSGSASLFSIIPLEVAADEEVMACDGKARLLRNDVITIESRRLITSLMIFNKSSKDKRGKEKLLFDRREVFSQLPLHRCRSSCLAAPNICSPSASRKKRKRR